MHIKRSFVVRSMPVLLAVSATVGALLATSYSQHPVKFSSADLSTHTPMRQASHEVNRSEWRPELVTPMARRPAAVVSSPPTSPVATPAAVPTVAKPAPLATPSPLATTPTQAAVQHSAVVTLPKTIQPAVVKTPARQSPAAPLPAGSHTDWMAAAGIAASDYGYVDYIVSHESGWDPFNWNDGGSGAYGLGQALPASKMAPYGSDYKTNPVTQLKWANAYAIGRYGSWYKAYRHWLVHYNW